MGQPEPLECAERGCARCTKGEVLRQRRVNEDKSERVGDLSDDEKKQNRSEMGKKKRQKKSYDTISSKRVILAQGPC
eukprot:scaffold47_cov258-Pinguiococcus_pyrenoidosus.AAC.89